VFAQYEEKLVRDEFYAEYGISSFKHRLKDLFGLNQRSFAEEALLNDQLIGIS